MSVPSGPIPDSYWVEPGRLLAGEYPGARDAIAATEKVGLIRSAGVDFFLDLTEEDEYGLRPYEADLEGLTCRRMAVRDLGCPTREEMAAILDTIAMAVDGGQCVYVHCYGGIGRTGTVIGCWLVRHGRSPAEALELIAERRRDTPDGARRSPETREQHDFVHAWEAYERGPGESAPD